MIHSKDLVIERLGPAQIPSPLQDFFADRECKLRFADDQDKAAFDPRGTSLHGALSKGGAIPMMELAGPTCNIFFEPSKVKAAVVTCGGLSPGINDVIRSIVLELYHRYGVRHMVGIPYGYQGFVPSYGHALIPLDPHAVRGIHREGGSMLKSSRGHQNTKTIVNFLIAQGINVLFLIGGDGTLRAGLEISEEAGRRKEKISVVGIPKTIDNDILYIDQSFGFETAFSKAVESIVSAHNEAHGAPNGIGLVKLMGRNSGFIACYAALAMNDVNFVLIPEVPFELEGDRGLLRLLEKRLKEHGNAVLVVAEGAGQDLIDGGEPEADASGNIRLKDIGLFLKKSISAYFEKIRLDVNLKYLDPSYGIRSIPATAGDRVYCLQLAEHAVHAAMSGRTKMVVGRRNGFFVYLPMNLIASGRKKVDPNGDLWLSVLNATGQPLEVKNRTVGTQLT